MTMTAPTPDTPEDPAALHGPVPPLPVPDWWMGHAGPFSNYRTPAPLPSAIGLTYWVQAVRGVTDAYKRVEVRPFDGKKPIKNVPSWTLTRDQARDIAVRIRQSAFPCQHGTVWLSDTTGRPLHFAPDVAAELAEQLLVAVAWHALLDRREKERAGW